MCNLRFIPFFPGNGQLGGVFAWHWSPRWGVFPPCDDDDDFSRLLREKVGAFKIQLGDEVLEVIIFLNKQFRKNGLYNILHQPEFCGVFFHLCHVWSWVLGMFSWTSTDTPECHPLPLEKKARSN